MSLSFLIYKTGAVFYFIWLVGIENAYKKLRYFKSELLFVLNNPVGLAFLNFHFTDKQTDSERLINPW